MGGDLQKLPPTRMHHRLPFKGESCMVPGPIVILYYSTRCWKFIIILPGVIMQTHDLPRAVQAAVQRLGAIIP